MAGGVADRLAPEPLMPLVHVSGQIVRLCVWLVLLTVLFAPLERLFALHDEKLFRKAVGVDIGYYFLSSLVPSFLLAAPLALVAWAVHHALPSAIAATVSAWPSWLRIVAALVIGDIGFYWGHRLSHEIPLLWRFHAIHHSAEHLDFLVNTRAHPVDMVFTRLCGLIPLYILGLAAPTGGSASLIPLLVLLLGTVWGFFVHANLRWRFGPLEWFVSTPAFHHWHHTNDGPAVLNKNFAPLLPFVDRLFGTLYLPAHRPARYGIDEPLPSGLLAQLLHPLSRKSAAPPPDESSSAGESTSTGPDTAAQSPQWPSESAACPPAPRPSAPLPGRSAARSA